ncbi:DUF4410 domain-containing protein [Acidisoma sp.]|uniref:DUF4410 domain-containing protein n=1 Tax=Acidisoma sp. TaxID=1872115 RepID=UPI003AFFF979
MLRHLRLVGLLAGAALGLAACSTHVQNTGTYVVPVQESGRATPRPSEVLVYGFTLDPDIIQLDSGVKARLAAISGSSNPPAERQELAYEITSAISQTLVDAIDRMGLPAVAASPGEQPRPGDVLIQGQIVRVTAGNATRRTLIGFGAGKSQVYANVQVLRAEPTGDNRLLQTYDANANSGRTPGLGLGAASAAAGHVAMAVAGSVAGTVARQRSGLAKDAEDLAKHVATNVGDFFAGQGWISPG